MKRGVYYLIIPGIHTDPRTLNSWTDKLTRFVSTRTPENVKAEGFEYFTTAATRWMKQKARAKELVRIIEELQAEGWTVRAICHSNGCDLATRAMLSGVVFDRLHFIGAAARDEQVSQCVKHERVGHLHLYGSKNDRALKVAKFSRAFLLQLVGLGFGSLGLRGPAFAEAHPERVTDHGRDDFDHSTWLQGAELLRTGTLILTNDGLLPT